MFFIGNTQADTPVPQQSDINFHTRAGQGEITEIDVKNEKDIDILDENELSALHWASAYGQYNSVNVLLNNGAKINLTGPDGETPLIFAASGGHHDVVRLLIEKGAKVNHEDDVSISIIIAKHQIFSIRIKIQDFFFFYVYLLLFLGWEYAANVCCQRKPSSQLQRADIKRS